MKETTLLATQRKKDRMENIKASKLETEQRSYLLSVVHHKDSPETAGVRLLWEPYGVVEVEADGCVVSITQVGVEVGESEES